MTAVDSTTNWYVDLVFDRPMDHAYTYSIPPAWVGQVTEGQRIEAPFGRGNRLEVGIAVRVHQQPPSVAPKQIHALLDVEPLVPESLLRLSRWLADYYLCSWGQALFAVIPAAVFRDAGLRETILIEAVPESSTLSPRPHLTVKQIAVLKHLRQRGPQPIRELARQVGCGATPIQALISKGLARRLALRNDTIDPPKATCTTDNGPSLTPDQQQTWRQIKDALESSRFQALLLHGVTGSGKTELYLRAISHVVSAGKQALVLVPEISLTPQTIDRFRGRCGSVAALHSHLRETERASYWRQIAQGRIQVVVGARSAVFAPLNQLGLIVVDEEHEQTFKQEAIPRYHARDVAVMRARMENIPIVLGSATPSLESWWNAQRGHYQLLTLPRRVLQQPLPEVQIIDLRHDGPALRTDTLSPKLEHAISDALADSGQVILLLNRRGFSTHIICPRCGYVATCDQCDLALTYHRHRQMLLCHYCGFQRPPIVACPVCSYRPLRYQGTGTEKLQAELERKFPQRLIRRMDSDTVERPGSHRHIFDEFRAGRIDILMGTQMIAKGLDFPNVTLVGVVNADVGLHLPDFRAAERTFQLLAQVAGRTGRGHRPGRVMIQTFTPEHPSIARAAQHDYVSFVHHELDYRRRHGYPPFQRLARLMIRSRQQEDAQTCAERFRNAFQAALRRSPDRAGTIRWLGPAECPVFRLNHYFRYHFQIHSSRAGILHEVLREVLASVQVPPRAEYQVDIDPYQML